MASAIPDNQILKMFAPLDTSMSRQLALGVSGGPDSMALMRLVWRWCELTARAPNSVTVFSVDHGLRAEAQAEAAAVCKRALELGFHAEALAWVEPKPKTGVQAAAREARYALMIEACKRRDIPILLTAHTQDDQTETLLMRLKRGSGLDGLAGIAPLSVRDGVTLFRPLLEVSKRRLLAYLRANGIGFFQDPSNENLAFERVGLRAQIRALEKAGVRSASLAQSAKRLDRAKHALRVVAERFLEDHFCVTPLGAGSIPCAALSELPDELYLRAMAQVLDLIGGASPSPRLAKLEQVLSLRGKAAWKITLGGCLILSRPNEIAFYREPGRIAARDTPLMPGQTLEWDRRFTIAFETEPSHVSNDPLRIAPLSERGWIAYCQSVQASAPPHKPDRLAALATPALWRGDDLIAAPLLGWFAPNRTNLNSQTLKAALRPRLQNFLK